jgi:hypothetical protein
MTLLDKILLLVTGVVAVYMIVRFRSRYSQRRELYDVYYIMAFVVLLISALLLIFMGYDILGSPFVLTVASLIPLGISMGLAEQFFPSWKTSFKWFALVGILAIALTSFGGMLLLKKIAVPLFHGVSGLVVILGPFFAARAPKGFRWVGLGGLLIGIAGMSLTFISAGSQLLFFSHAVVLQIFAGLLLSMALAFAWGFMKDIRA